MHRIQARRTILSEIVVCKGLQTVRQQMRVPHERINDYEPCLGAFVPTVLKGLPPVCWIKFYETARVWSSIKPIIILYREQCFVLSLVSGCG